MSVLYNLGLSFSAMVFTLSVPLVQHIPEECGVHLHGCLRAVSPALLHMSCMTSRAPLTAGHACRSQRPPSGAFW